MFFPLERTFGIIFFCNLYFRGITTKINKICYCLKVKLNKILQYKLKYKILIKAKYYKSYTK